MWESASYPHSPRNIAQSVYDIAFSCTTCDLGFNQFGLNQVTPWPVGILAYTDFDAPNFYEHATLPPLFRDSHACGRDKLIDHCSSQQYKQPPVVLNTQRLLQRTTVKKRAMGFKEISTTGAAMQLPPSSTIGSAIGADIFSIQPAVVRAIRIRAVMTLGVDLAGTTARRWHHRRWLGQVPR